MTSRAAYGCASCTLLVLMACTAPCPETVDAKVSNPSNTLVAERFSYECGPVPPFNMAVRLRARDGSSGDQLVLRITEIPLTAELSWSSDTVLDVLIDCPFADSESCIPAGRHWTIDRTPPLGDVSVRYKLGPGLARMVDPPLRERIVGPRLEDR